MAIVESEAVLLKKTELRETSLILNFFTRTSGKITGVIKGVRSPQPQFGALFELFSLDRIVFYERKARDIYTIAHCDLVDFFPAARGDLTTLAHAVYYAELVDRTCGIGEVNEAIFDLLVGSLRALAGPDNARPVTRMFQIKLLQLLGLMPRLRHCSDCGQEYGPEGVRFSIRDGGILCRNCSSGTPGTSAIMPGTINFIDSVAATPLERVLRVTAPDEVGRQVEQLLRGFLNFHVQTRLKSVEFMEQVGIL